MIIKTFVMVLCTVVGGAIGWQISARTVRKRRYFEELIYLINSLVCDISFKQTSLAQLISEKTLESVVIKQNVDEFLRYATGENKRLKISKRDLNESEYIFINELFSALGRYDLNTQVYVLEGYRRKAEEFYSEAKRMEDKRSKPAKKLGILVGMTVGILFL